MNRAFPQLSFVPIVVSYGLFAFSLASADDWPMFGREKTRNAVSPETNPPMHWNVGEFDRDTLRPIGAVGRAPSPAVTRQAR